jgi:hypothetical protein
MNGLRENKLEIIDKICLIKESERQIFEIRRISVENLGKIGNLGKMDFRL